MRVAVVRTGRNIVTFTSSFARVPPSRHDARTLLMAWPSIVVGLPKRAADGTR